MWNVRTLFALLCAALIAAPAVARPYAWPLKKYAGCSSLFGDYRPRRYHAGIDLRTGGEEGWRVVAVGDGYVMRASTSYYGYGRALYLKLDDGRIAVYGHLQSFGPQITSRVRAEQKKLKRYRTDLHFEPNAIRVRKGMTIARSGQTGAGAPHLHFGLRTAENRPLNPLHYGFPISDRRDPEIRELWLVPVQNGGSYGRGPNGMQPARIAVRGSAQAPLRVASGPIPVAGPVGFAVEAYDRKPGTSRRYNITASLLIVGNDTVFQARFDTLDFSTMSRVELERMLWLDHDGDVYALFKRPGNDMAHSRTHPDHPFGYVSLQPGDSEVPFKLVVQDEDGNRRTILGELSYAETGALLPAVDSLLIRASAIEYRPDRIPGLAFARALQQTGLDRRAVPRRRDPAPVKQLYAVDVPRPEAWLLPDSSTHHLRAVLTLRPDSAARFVLPDSSLEVEVPAGGVYEPAFMTIEKSELPGKPPIWRLGPEDLVLRKSARLSFAARPDTLWSLWTVGGDGDADGFVERRWENGRIECTASGPVAYTFGRDETPPIIRRLKPAEGARVKGDVIVQALIEDDLSGVGNDTMITVLLDGEWIVPEYDTEMDRLIARPWQKLQPGEHTLQIEVFDWAGNRAVRKRTFQVVK
jgi:hypothetical protein